MEPQGREGWNFKSKTSVFQVSTRHLFRSQSDKLKIEIDLKLAVRVVLTQWQPICKFLLVVALVWPKTGKNDGFALFD